MLPRDGDAFDVGPEAPSALPCSAATRAQWPDRSGSLSHSGRVKAPSIWPVRHCLPLHADSGGGLFGLNAELAYRAEEDRTYRVVVDDPTGQTGGYTLTVRRDARHHDGSATE